MDGSRNKLNLFPITQRLFSYEHVVCFDLLDPSCLQECENEGYYAEADTDDDYTNNRDVEVALHKAECSHECGHVRISAIVRSD